jgi:hypothetical protein
LGEPFREIGLAQPRFAQKQHRRELHRFVGGDGQRQTLAQIVDDVDEIGRFFAEIVDCRRCRRLDDVARPAQLPHPVVPTLEALVVQGCTISERPLHVSDRIDRLQIGNRNDGFHGSCSSFPKSKTDT